MDAGSCWSTQAGDAEQKVALASETSLPHFTPALRCVCLNVAKQQRWKALAKPVCTGRLAGARRKRWFLNSQKAQLLHYGGEDNTNTRLSSGESCEA